MGQSADVNARCPHIALCACACGIAFTLHAQPIEPHGQASAWLTGNPEHPSLSQLGVRYVPDLLVEHAIDSGFSASMDLSLNAWGSSTYQEGKSSAYDGRVKLYRAWARFASETFELRVGLQKITFGSALLFRPLMWFDQIDPRDPLQMTDGVYGVLARYYLLDNVNVWLWGLYGNNDPKGWETAPTEKGSVEYGGRAQTPLWTGELGITYHHRRADLGRSPLVAPSTPVSLAQSVPEDRVALDGKWDLGIGAWFEAAMIRELTDLPGFRYQRQWTVGADYTFGIGNGLYAATEFFRNDFPRKPFGNASGQEFSGLSLSYPLGILDVLSAIVYRDWTNRAWYRIATWQRKYDNWSFYLLAYWNPTSFQVFRPTNGASAFAGTGAQLTVVFNH